MDYRTDLALERRELIEGEVPDGVDFSESDRGRVHITHITVRTPQGAQALKKPEGNYITVEMPLPSADPTQCDDEIEAVAASLCELIPQGEDAVLIAGLGNRNITPDALGPKTVDFSLATRHISDKMPELNFSPVAAIAPGVMGQTGIETGDIIKGVCEKIKIRCVIAVDALASKSTERLGKTVQISDSGISPGSGVGNARAELSKGTLGVPVIAVGVPTVVDALTVARDALGAETMGENPGGLESLMVTPREIDSLITAVSRVLALGIGRALQPSLSVSELFFLSV